MLQLGGAQGITQGWPTCLGCVVTGDLIGWRSSLGNQLAEASKAKGLAPVGVVAYVEVRPAHQQAGACCSAVSTQLALLSCACLLPSRVLHVRPTAS